MSQDLFQKKISPSRPTRPPPPRLANNTAAAAPSPPPRPSRPPASSQHKLQDKADKPLALLSQEKKEKTLLPPHPPPPLSTSYQQQKVEKKTTEEKRDSSSLSLTTPAPPPYSSSTLLQARREKKDPPPARPDYSPVFIVKRRSKSSENITLANSPFLAVKATGSTPSDQLPPRSKTPQQSYYTPPPVTRILSHKDKGGSLDRPSAPVPFPRRNKNKGPSRPPEPLPRTNISKEVQSRTPPIPRERSRATKELFTKSLPYTGRTYPPPLSLTTPVPLFSRASLSPSHSVPEDIYALPNTTSNRVLSIQSEPDTIEWYASSDDAVHKNELEQDSSYSVPHIHGVVAPNPHQETIEWYASTDDISHPFKEESLSTTGGGISEDGYMVMSSISGHVGSDSGIGGEEIEGGDNMYLPLNALERDEENTYSIPVGKGSTPIDTIIEEPPLYTDPCSLNTYTSSSVPTDIYMPLQETNDTNGSIYQPLVASKIS